MWTTYLVECRDGTLYCGVTNDLMARLRAHDAGKGAKYTRGRGPVKLVRWVGGMTKGDALRLEAAVKRRPKADKERFMGCSRIREQ